MLFYLQNIARQLGKTVDISKARKSNPCPLIDPSRLLDPLLGSPAFLYVGVAKGGSTSLSEYLPFHPQVAPVRVKEANFFSFPWLFQMTPDRYSSMFPSPTSEWDVPSGHQFKGRLGGEYSTSYLQHPTAPRYIAAALPQARILMFLRNPIDRAYSHFVMQRRAGLESLSFEEVIQREMEDLPVLLDLFRHCYNGDKCDLTVCLKEGFEVLHHRAGATKWTIESGKDLKQYMFTSYLARSLYDDQVERYLALFPREQIFVVDSTDFYRNTSSVLDQITDFLRIERFNFTSTGILDHSWGGGASNSHKPQDYTPLNPHTRQLLHKFFEPFNRRLFTLLGRDFGWH